MTNQVATRDAAAIQAAPAHNDASAIIQVIERAAMNPEVDIDKMERLLQMQERIYSRNAEMEFNAAMSAMQDEMPSIAERGRSHNGNYATFEDINDVAKPIMKRHGFSVTFRVKNIQGGIEVTGVLMHKAGHREETTMTLPLDTSGSKNNVQAVGSSVSYGKRYVMSALLNITTRGADDDGNAAAPTKTVTAFQSGQIAQTVGRCPTKTQEWFASTFGDASQVPKAKFDSLMAQLNKIIKESGNADPQS